MISYLWQKDKFYAVYYFISGTRVIIQKYKPDDGTLWLYNLLSTLRYFGSAKMLIKRGFCYNRRKGRWSQENYNTLPLLCILAYFLSSYYLYPTSFSNNIYSLCFTNLIMLFLLLLTPLFSCPSSKLFFCPPGGWNTIFLYVYIGHCTLFGRYLMALH